MCGICGIASSEKAEPLSLSFLSSMCQTIIHRGPDDEGLFVKKNIALGTRRLSIIDIEGGHQPLANEDSSIWVAHNGEVYNFPDLRKELKSYGHSFNTKTDTETLVHSYEEWGEDFVHKLRGMYAFALWDEREEKLLLVRDRVGIKPLYYTLLEDKTLVFGSELKAVIAHPRVKRVLEPRALDLFLTLEYVPAPFSIYKGIYKLPPGCLLIYKGGKKKIKKYWDIKPEEVRFQEISRQTLASLMDKLYALLKESVELRLISDVPLGAFLSGGIDSSTIVGLMSELGVSPLKTFSIGFDYSSYDELQYARHIAKKFNTTHKEYILKPKALELTEKLIYHLDEPFGDFSIFPTYLISQVSRSEVKVILSGDGGDELFSGYEHYQAQKISQLTSPLPLLKGMQALVKKFPPSAKKKGFWNKLRRYSQGFEHDPTLRHLRWMMFLSLENKKALFSKAFIQELDGIKEIYETEPFSEIFKVINHFDTLSGELYLDMKTYLPDDILVKVDRMSMATSLETRVPLLDHKIAEFAFQLPGKFKLQGLTTKWIFKKTMERLLPRKNIYRSKEGFSIPIKHWLTAELKDLMSDYLSERRIKGEGLFNYDFVGKMVDTHLKGRENYSHQLWSLLVFEIWKEKYL